MLAELGNRVRRRAQPTLQGPFVIVIRNDVRLAVGAKYNFISCGNNLAKHLRLLACRQHNRRFAHLHQPINQRLVALDFETADYDTHLLAPGKLLVLLELEFRRGAGFLEIISRALPVAAHLGTYRTLGDWNIFLHER